MKHNFLTEEELEFLSNNIADVVELFKEAHIEVKVELQYMCNTIRHKILDNNNSYKKILLQPETAYNDGYCFYFARIIKTIFPDSNFIVIQDDYELIDHIALEYNGELIDINFNDEEKPFDLSNAKYANIEDLSYANNMFHSMNNEIYEKLKYKFLRNVKSYLNKNFYKKKSLKI